ncbi:MAG: hypothetical protein ACK4E5_05855, partial [Erythrobacter cryptus]
GGFLASPFSLRNSFLGGGFCLLARTRLGLCCGQGLGRCLGLAPGALFSKGALLGLLARARLGGGACRSLCRGLCLVGFGRGGGRGRGRLSRRVDQPERAAPRARAPVQARACGPAVSGLLRSA